MKVVVDDRAFVVGLSELFREEMKNYEVATLLPLAEAACKALNLSPAMVPTEGYYTETVELERYFRLIRTLQYATVQETSLRAREDATRRLHDVLTSPAMGRVEGNDRVLPRTTSPLGEALCILSNWSIDGLSRQAAQLLRKDDAGLVAVAAAASDPVALCVARESMALVADVELAEIELQEFVWAVSERVTEVARRFVSALTNATGIVLPEPAATSSHLYGQAARDAELVGRCILMGERFSSPYPYYHWYIGSHDGQLTVKDFWSSNVWTTADLRKVPIDGQPAAGAQVGAPRLGNEPRGGGTGSSFDPRKEDQGQQKRKGWLARLLEHGR